jgi:hypothetical protein
VENAKLINKVRAWGAAVGPYVLLEAVMPGGTLMALLLYLHRRNKCRAC